MSDIAILKEMIKADTKVALEEQQNGKRINYFVTLTEPQHNYSVAIYGMPKYDDVIVIKADAFVAPSAVFNGLKGECKRADFVIVADTSLEKIIICIEIKKKKDSNKIIIQQLTGAQCFIAYCKAIGKAFWLQKNFLDKYEYRFVSIGHISIPKKKTRPKRKSDTARRDGIHNSPDQMLKISSPDGLQFNYLVEGDN